MPGKTLLARHRVGGHAMRSIVEEPDTNWGPRKFIVSGNSFLSIKFYKA